MHYSYTTRTASHDNRGLQYPQCVALSLLSYTPAHSGVPYPPSPRRARAYHGGRHGDPFEDPRRFRSPERDHPWVEEPRDHMDTLGLYPHGCASCHCGRAESWDELGCVVHMCRNTTALWSVTCRVFALHSYFRGTSPCYAVGLHPYTSQ